jgi:hypothetical protein
MIEGMLPDDTADEVASFNAEATANVLEAKAAPTTTQAPTPRAVPRPAAPRATAQRMVTTAAPDPTVAAASAAAPAPEPANLDSTNRIVIVDNEQFTVPLAISDEDVRRHLAVNFPGVRDATITHGYIEIAGLSYRTTRFEKQAGLKGGDIDTLMELLRDIPAAPIRQDSLIDQIRPLLRGEVTFGEALATNRYTEALEALLEQGRPAVSTGGKVCRALAHTQPVPVATVPGW